ncbi:unnamed protein product [Rhizophagus irregularis]|nr:unnamed protein product [Rhizophagus irregularis]
MRVVVRLGMLLRGTLNVASANIIDKAIDEVLIARSKVIKRNTKRARVSIDPGVRAPLTWYSPTKDRSISKRRKNS